MKFQNCGTITLRRKSGRVTDTCMVSVSPIFSLLVHACLFIQPSPH